MGGQSWPSAWPLGFENSLTPSAALSSSGVLLEWGSVWSLLPGAGLKSVESYHLTAGPMF